MVKVERGNITLTRGDSAYFAVRVDNYTPASGDTLTLTIKHAVDTNSAVLTKTVASDAVIAFAPSDTAQLPAQTYVYDVKLIINATQEKFTVVGTHDFTLVRGVGE